jgi:CMP-N,N'-diacetyllegionaminic acid synthase
MNIQDLYIVALIPARSGSKGIKDKNIKLYKGLPLIQHSIKIALKSKYIKDVYVSTDSIKYQEIAINCGSKITPLRPQSISDDLSPDIDVFKFFLNNFEKKPDVIIHLRPTYPNRKIEILDDCIEKFINNYNEYDSLRTVINLKKTPYKMYFIENNNLKPYFTSYQNLIEPFNQARQYFPDTYLHNGCIDIIKSSIILEQNLLSGKNILPYIMEDNEDNDIDDIYDFNKSEIK